MFEQMLGDGSSNLVVDIFCVFRRFAIRRFIGDGEICLANLGVVRVPSNVATKIRW